MNRYARLEDVVCDPVFPAVDHALRRGAHIDDEEVNWYIFLQQAQGFLEPFYERYGAELIRASGNYFYLRPHGQLLKRRRFPAGAMLTGQALALAFLDPSATRQAGVVQRTQILETLHTVFGEQRLRQTFVKGKRAGEKVAREAIQKGLDQGFRLLAELGFITLLGSDQIRLRQPLTRFMEPHKGTDQAQAIQQLLAQGDLDTEAGERSFEQYDEEEA